MEGKHIDPARFTFVGLTCTTHLTVLFFCLRFEIVIIADGIGNLSKLFYLRDTFREAVSVLGFHEYNSFCTYLYSVPVWELKLG